MAPLEAFSVRALWLVPLMALAGVAMAALLLPDLAALGRPYGMLLIAKALLFSAALAAAALNRRRWLPALRAGSAAARRGLFATLVPEYLVLAAAIAVTAVMSGAFSPYDR